MKILKFNSYIKESNNSNLKNWAYEYAKNNHFGLNSYEDAIYELDIFFNHEYPNMKDKFKLYRILSINNKNDIDVDDLGLHYLHSDYIDRIYQKGWYESIGVNLNNEFKNIYLIEVEVYYNDVNWEHTIDSRLNFPREFEITLNEKSKPTISNIFKIDKKLIK